MNFSENVNLIHAMPFFFSTCADFNGLTKYMSVPREMKLRESFDVFTKPTVKMTD